MKQLKDNEKIPYGRQYIDERDVAAVKNVLKSDFLTQGPQVEFFEKDISKRVSSKYAVAVNSATSALHIACLAIGLGKGDILWTVPNSSLPQQIAGFIVEQKLILLI